MILTRENYHSLEARKAYMSASQFKAFQSCEAAALAENRGEFEKDKTAALLVGLYVDAHFEGTLDVFRAKNPEIFTRSGDLKSEYRHAEYVIQRIEQDDRFMEYLVGTKQVIMTGSMEGVPMRIMMDIYAQGSRIVDLKIMKDFAPIWVDGQGRLPFAEAWGYDVQGAIYREIVRQNTGDTLPFYLAAATKEKEPDHEIIEIPEDALNAAFEWVTLHIGRYQAIRTGIEVPERCGKCDYCRMTKVVGDPVDYRLM